MGHTGARARHADLVRDLAETVKRQPEKLAQTEKGAAAITNREVIKNYCMADEWLDKETAAVELAV